MTLKPHIVYILVRDSCFSSAYIMMYPLCFLFVNIYMWKVADVLLTCLNNETYCIVVLSSRNKMHWILNRNHINIAVCTSFNMIHTEIISINSQNLLTLNLLYAFCITRIEINYLFLHYIITVLVLQVCPKMYPHKYVSKIPYVPHKCRKVTSSFKRPMSVVLAD